MFEPRFVSWLNELCKYNTYLYTGMGMRQAGKICGKRGADVSY